MKCPACAETNEDGMQFCIYCGNSLQIQAAPSPSMSQSSMPQPALTQPLISQTSMAQSGFISNQMAPVTNQVSVLICTVCQKTDPLNAQFCVFCGGQTSAVQSPLSQIDSSANLSGVGQPISAGDFRASRKLEAQYAGSGSGAFAHAKGKSGRAGAVLTLLLAILMGLAAGLALTYYFRDKIEEFVLYSYFPDEGALIFSKSADADVEIRDVKKKTIAFGRTSKSGTLHVLNLTPGSYTLKLNSSDGKTASSHFSVNASDGNLVGYPKKLELK